MKNYIGYKSQIKGFGDVSVTVKAVEKIAASSVHFLRQKSSNLNDYAVEIETMILDLSPFYYSNNNFLLQKGLGKPAVILITGEKGIVGGLWHDIVNKFLDNKNKYNYVIVVGSKGKNYLKEENIKIYKFFSGSDEVIQMGKGIDDIVNYIFSEFKKGTFSNVDVLYPKYISLGTQEPAVAKFLPFEFELAAKGKISDGMPIFEPSKANFFNRLLQKYIGIYFHKLMIETKLSELSARTIAAENASDKTNEFIKKLTFDFMKERRKYVTQKQLESFSVHKMI